MTLSRMAGLVGFFVFLGLWAFERSISTTPEVPVVAVVPPSPPPQILPPPEPASPSEPIPAISPAESGIAPETAQLPPAGTEPAPQISPEPRVTPEPQLQEVSEPTEEEEPELDWTFAPAMEENDGEPAFAEDADGFPEGEENLETAPFPDAFDPRDAGFSGVGDEAPAYQRED